MTTLDFARVRKLVELVHDAPDSERARILERECGGDHALRREVEDLLRASARDPKFLTRSSELPRAETLLPEFDGKLGVAQPSSLNCGASIGGFKLVRHIASGGMGSVWEAEQVEPRRRVALKTLRFGLDSAEAVRRFRHEAEILARLKHQGIALVFASGVHREGGEREGLPWYAMEYVDDARTLTEYAREHSLDLAQRLRLFLALCSAVQHGHERGVIHRDLKPSNVLVDGAGELKVIDFGVARWREPGSSSHSMQTEAGRVLGTLQYMSPEQVSGASDGLDTRSDVYALGVILYELIANDLPYDLSRASLAQAALILTDETPRKPSARVDGIHEDLDAIALKALEKERERRYASAAALAHDIGRFLRGEPVEARPPSRAYQVRVFARRHRVLVGSIAAVMLTLVVAAPIGFWLAWRASRAETDALSQRDLARFREYGAEIAAAYTALRAHDSTSARQHLDRCETSARGFEWWMLDQRVDRSLWTRACDGSTVVAALWHPDGSRILVGTDAGGIDARDPASGELLATANLGCALSSMVVDPKGRTLLACARNDLCIIDANSLELERRWRAHERTPVCATFTPGGTALSCSAQGDVVEWDLEHGVRLRELERTNLALWCIAVSPDSRFVAAGTASLGEVVVWDFVTGQLLHRMPGHLGYVGSVAFDRDSSILVSASHDHTLRVWNPCTGELQSILRGHDDLVLSARFDSTGQRLASTGWDRTIRLWDPSDGRMLATLFGAGGNVGPCSFSPDGTRLVAGDSTSHVKLWNVDEPDRDVVQVRGKWMWTLRFWPDGESVLAVHGGWAHRFATSSDRVLAEYPYHRREWRGADVSPDGASIALGDTGGNLEVVSADGRRTLARASTSGGALLALDWSRDGARLAGASEDGSVFVFEGEQRNPRELTNVGTSVRALAFAPAGDELAVVGARGDLRMLDAEDGTLRWTGAPSFSAALDLAWSPDGKHVAVALADGRVTMWNVATRTCEREFLGHALAASAVAFSPDGTRLASGSHDRSIRLWEADTGRELANLIDHAYLVEALAFSPDGATLVSGSSDSTLRWWRAPSAAERLVAERARDSFLGREVRSELAHDAEIDPQVAARAQQLASALVDDPFELVREAWITAAAPSSEPTLLRDALARAQVAVRFMPDDPRALRALAATQLRLGENEQALDTLERCSRLDRRDPMTGALRALALAHAGRTEQAREVLDEVTNSGDAARPSEPAFGKLIGEVKAALGAP